MSAAQSNPEVERILREMESAIEKAIRRARRRLAEIDGREVRKGSN